MKIGYLLQQGLPGIRTPPYSGPVNHVIETIRALEIIGNQVTLLTRDHGEILLADDALQFRPIAVRQMDSGLSRMVERVIRRTQSELKLPYFSLFDSVRFALACLQELDDADLFYERFSWMSYGGCLAAKMSGTPIVLEENGNPLMMMDQVGNAPQGIQRWLEKQIMTWAAHSVSHTVASGDGWKALFIEYFGVEKSSVSTVQNGSALVTVLSRDELTAFQEEDDLDDTVTLVYVGGFYPWQGVSILLRACRRAVSAGIHLRLMLIGDGQGRKEAEIQGEESGIAAHLTFTGQLSLQELATQLSQAHIGLSPYCGWKEYSGMKILDYKAAGLATIASGMGDQPSTLAHGLTGLIVPPCDEDRLTEAIITLVKDPKQRKAMGRRARLEAEQLHTWTHTATQLQTVFQHMQSR